MPEINSVAGQLVGIPVGQVYTAGEGVVVDNVHKTITSKYNETVLYDGGLNPDSVSSITLSETTMNFERIVILACANTQNATSNIGYYRDEFSTAIIHARGGYFTTRHFFDGESGSSTGGFTWHTIHTRWSGCDTSTWTRKQQRLDSMGDQTNNNWYRPYLILGVNRIANN